MEQVEEYKQLLDNPGLKHPEHLFINSFPINNKDFRGIFIQILKVLDALYISEGLLYQKNFKNDSFIPVNVLDTCYRNPVSGIFYEYELIKKLCSVSNIYEARQIIGQDIHPRWIFFPIDVDVSTIAFTYFFEKIVNKKKTDYTQISIEQSQEIFNEIMMDNGKIRSMLGDIV